MIIYIADWFAQLNHKMGGDLSKIQDVGKYFIEVFRSCGINMDGTKFIWASEFIGNNKSYWARVLDISSKNSVTRIKRTVTALGRSEGDELSVSQLIYPCMQCADIFELNIDICQLGVDQRKVNMLAREYASDMKIKPPIILSHHMLMSLRNPKTKMSKSDPMSAIFVEDSEEQVKEKIIKAFCDDNVTNNPIYEYIKYILFRWFGKLDLCEKTYINMETITNDFPSMNKTILKENVCKYLNIILEPIRKHFEKPELKELVDKVASYKITR